MRRFAPFHTAISLAVSLLISGACSLAAAAPPPPSGDFAALEGIWQQTRSSGSDFRNLTTGYEFSATEGFSTQLIVGDTGNYYQAYFSSGYQPSCSNQLTYFEQSAGTVAVSGNQLTLQPSQHQVTVTGCNPGVTDLGTAPIVYTFAVRQQFYDASGRTYYMSLEGGPHPLDLVLLHHAPASPPYQPAQPEDFLVGTTQMFAEFMGTWTPNAGSRLDFYDPATNQYYVPDRDGNHHHWLRFYSEVDRNYEFATVWRDPYGQGVCRKDYIYWERGKTLFYLLEGDSTGAFGHVRFQATEARLLVDVSECGELDYAQIYSLTPTTSYYRFRYISNEDEFGHPTAESMSINCYWERSEWQYMLCEDTNWQSYNKR